jgi:hypothetical protein
VGFCFPNHNSSRRSLFFVVAVGGVVVVVAVSLAELESILSSLLCFALLFLPSLHCLMSVLMLLLSK